MEEQVDRVIACSDEVKDFSDYENELIWINYPSVEKSLEYTDLRINGQYHKDIDTTSAPLVVNISQDSPKEIDYIEDSEGNRFPSVQFDEVADEYLPYILAIKVSGSDEMYRVFVPEVDLENDIIRLPSEMAEGIIDEFDSFLRSTWIKF